MLKDNQDIFLTAIQNPTLQQNVQVHLLCERSAYFLQLLRSNSRRLHVLFWCGDWNRYFEVLERDCYQHTHVVAVVSTISWRIILATSAKLLEGACSHVKWVLVNGTDGPSSTNLRPSVTTFLRDAINPLTQPAPSSDIAATYKQMPANGAVPGRPLAGQVVSVGCITINKAAVGENCFSFKENTLAQALHAINSAYNITAIKRGKFAKALRRKQVDIVANTVGITRARYRHFAFTVNRFGQAVYYVKKNWKREADLFFFGVLPWMFLLALFMVLSAGSIVFLNLRRGNRPTNGLGDVVLVLTATTLAFSSPLPSQHARNTLSRLIMASWMLACLSLVIYTRSLLTASLMAGPSWEADDSLDEILPKLQRGRLLPVHRDQFILRFRTDEGYGKRKRCCRCYGLGRKA
ncbi:hypothetical protein HPB50_020881 [Hyalomma asiaticum]|uniref:Uncharacterized protein n=1 Tax=Hyalomma asiaticum TaxID=266040 RepID=A0ACB7TBJ6_HYAAI|nr:hypothetical protein HPB50_020881 [Hyalomma asiaticum]